MISASQAVSLGRTSSGRNVDQDRSEAVDAENVAQVARCVREKREVRPDNRRVYPAGHRGHAPEERHEQISIGCRIAAELGPTW